MWVIKHRKIFLGFSAAMMVVSLSLIAIFGLNFGIEFTGGSITEIYYGSEAPTVDEVNQALAEMDPERSFQVQRTEKVVDGETVVGYIIRSSDLGEGRADLLSALSFETFEARADRFSSIGPSIGAELRTKALIAIVIVITAIVFYIAYVFRGVSKPVSSWKYGATAILALVHDILIPIGVFAVLGSWLGAEIDVLFVTALLAILGFSVNDTIVVFDRIRENLRLNEENNLKEDFDQVVGHSLEQTYVRSINTSLTTLFVLGTLFVIGGSVTQFFALVLIIGVIAGTYSSIFLASPVIVEIERRQKLTPTDK